jgi:hypothetical protein
MSEQTDGQITKPAALLARVFLLPVGAKQKIDLAGLKGITHARNCNIVQW